MLNLLRRIQKKIQYGIFTNYRGSGTKNDPFLVSNSTELYNLMENIRIKKSDLKIHIKLVDDIVFEYSDASSIYMRYICIDGAGCTIENADFYGRINKGCYIKNVTLVNCSFVNKNRGKISNLTFSDCDSDRSPSFLIENDGHVRKITVINCELYCIIQSNYGIVEDISVYNSVCDFFCRKNKAGKIESISSDDTTYHRGIIELTHYGDFMYSVFTSTNLDTNIDHHLTVFVFKEDAEYTFESKDVIRFENIGIKQLQSLSEQQVRYLDQRNLIDINEQTLEKLSQKELNKLSNKMITTLAETGYISEETQVVSLI